MPSSKTDTSIRYPESEDQHRRLRNVTQDRKWASRMQDEARTSKSKAESSTTWSADQMLGSGIDSYGQPVPNPASFSDGAKEKKQEGGEESDLYEAANQDFD